MNILEHIKKHKDVEKARESYYRVTEVLCPFNGYGAAPAALMKQYQHRGTVVHKACNRFTEIGHEWCLDLSIDGIAATDSEIKIAKPYVDSFSQWWDPSNMEVIEKERRLYDDELELTGEFDFIIRKDNEFFIADIKTSKAVNKTWLYQLSAYRHLINVNDGTNTFKLMVIQVNEGTSCKEYLYEYDFDTFKKALDLYKIFCPRKKVIYEESE